MGVTRRQFTLEFRTDAAHRVIDSGRSVSEVAKELSIAEHLLYKWVRDERRRLEAADATCDRPLTVAERKELTRLRRVSSFRSATVKGRSQVASAASNLRLSSLTHL